jgi:4-hydroxythreonine-4-phosphate dehydrogenase
MSLPVIAVTMGDPAGVGPEICLHLLANTSFLQHCTPVVFGDAAVLARAAQACRLPRPVQIIQGPAREGALANLGSAAVLDLPTNSAELPQPGMVSAATGEAAYTYIEQAIEAALAGAVQGVTTGPIHKEALRAAGINYPGHTEIFAARTGAERICMMLTSADITCSFVTTHVGYREVPSLLSVERVRQVIELTADALRRLRGREPRLVVCGLNPHGGEHGLFGEREEERFILPAVEAMRDQGFRVEGPLPPDTAFLPARRRETDGFICMYHDQGHIPLKALAFDEAVNITLGLPIIRTSVDHGTALDIAWQGKANPNSLFQAVRLAARLASRGP